MKRKALIVTRVFGFLALALLLSGTVYGTDWTQWRGPNANGISTETGWNPNALDQGPDITWRLDVGKGHSTVAVKGNYLYTMGNRRVGSDRRGPHEDMVFCIDNRTGKEIWRYAYPCGEGRFPGPRSTPVLDGDKLYTISMEGHLFCFNAKNGKILWKRHVVDEGLAKLSEWGFSFSPVIDGDLLLLNLGKSGVAMNKKNGKVIWKSAPERGGLGSAVLFNSGGKRLAAIQGANMLHTVDVKTGNIVWSYKWSSYQDPVLLGNDLFYLSGGRARTKKGCALIKVKDGKPEELWHNKQADYAFQSRVIINGYAYGLRRANGEYLQCIDIKTGDEKWSREMSDWGSLMAAGDKLIVLEGDGDLTIVQATSEKYTEIGRAKLIKMKDWKTYDRNEPNTCWTAPVLANGYVYGRNTHGELVCVNLNKK